MTPLAALWLPILVSAVVVFIASSIIHMAPLWHRGDYPRLKNEDDVLKALRPLSLPAGDYMFPRASGMAAMKEPAYLEKLKQGPVAMITVFEPGSDFGMGRQMVQWFVFCLVVGVFSAYIAGTALPPGAEYLRVFQLAGATAFIAYAAALAEMSIWFRRGWSLTLKGTLDGLIYGALTAGVFGWLWPV